MQAFTGLHDARLDELFVVLPISVSNCSLGMTPASLSAVALTMTMNFM
jgi:hypothetical protein